ncbi:uncharacterized protein LOC124895505 [Capsicum annuum]|uniref:uncharacterized protein LOC124895505 n=1 Tax=Capsicum annuum TaxID=4072 RepID=UPI001FB09D20|nr:uncharacterized protein LOC124895505 [Capsicum annuum]
MAPDWSKPFKIMCHASGVALGADLGQKRGKLFHAINYANKALNGATKNYTVTQQEILGVVYAFEKFRAYLLGTKVEIVALFDNEGKRVVAFLKKQNKREALILSQSEEESESTSSSTSSSPDKATVVATQPSPVEGNTKTVNVEDQMEVRDVVAELEGDNFIR